MESVKIIVIDQGHTIAYETYCLLIEVLNDTRIELESLSPYDCTGDTIYTQEKIYLYNLYLIILEEDLWEMNGVLHDKCIEEIENTIQNMFYLEKNTKDLLLHVIENKCKFSAFTEY